MTKWLLTLTLVVLLPAAAVAAPSPVARGALCKPDKPDKAKAAGKDDKKKKRGKTTKTAPDREPAPEEGEAQPAPDPAPGAAPAAAPAGKADEDGRSLQRGERVEFDARLIQGQTAKAGAVYLFARVPTNLKSMVRERTTFREKIVRTVYPDQEDAP